MKTIQKFKIVLLMLLAVLSFACSSQRGSAADRTGTNGATNGTGKIPKSNSVHNFKN